MQQSPMSGDSVHRIYLTTASPCLKAHVHTVLRAGVLGGCLHLMGSSVPDGWGRLGAQLALVALAAARPRRGRGHRDVLGSPPLIYRAGTSHRLLRARAARVRRAHA
jgi:hypothetical protein